MKWPDWLNLWPNPVDSSYKEGNCQLLGPFALLLQLSMGAVAILSLVYKRSKEHPRRPWWIWFFDVSKQILGAGGLHFLNILASIFFSSSRDPGVDTNPCNWYFLNILLDTTIGVPVLWFFLYLIHTGCFRLGVKGIVSGRYGNPPQWSSFLKQAWLYMIALVCMKCVLYVFVWWMPFMDDLGAFLISWTSFDERVQEAFVMMVFPLM